MKYRLCLYLAFLLSALGTMAQHGAGAQVHEGGYGLVKTNITATYDHTFGRVTDGFNARASYEFLKKTHITLSANLRYQTVTTGFRQSDLDTLCSPDAINLNGTHHMGQAGITATARAMLFGKPMMGIGIVNSEWGKGGFNRVSATLMALLMLKADRSTQFGVGVLGMVNTTSRMPVFPVFFYRHRINPQWLINLYGGMLGVDYNATPNDLFSIGADVDVKSFYFRPGVEWLPKTCRYTQTNFRPMLKYRRRILTNLYFDAQTGYAVNMRTRVNAVNGRKTYLKLSQSPHPFLQFAVSYSL